MAIRDRGLMKFRTVALQPEFISNLKQMHREQEYVEQPELDEQQFEHLNMKICEAMEFTEEITVTYHKVHSILKDTGHIHYFDVQKNEIRLVTKSEGECLCIPLVSIIDIS